ncbi:MAG: alpha/beta hydrolase [Planctomycetota bacterium]|nr:alpha/beta hydrolase [Planctomycetota bacterium]
MNKHIIIFIAAISSHLPHLSAQQTRYRDPVFSQVKVTKDVQFGSAVNRYTNQTQILRLDIYEPQGDTAKARPVLMMVHGGGFYTGQKDGAHYVKVCTEAAQRGFVSVSIDYRLRPRSGSTSRVNVIDASHDMKAAVRWLRKNKTSLRLDTDRFGCMGSSAGSVTCLQAAYTSDEGQSGNPGYSSRVHAVIDMWGHLPDLTEMTTGEAPVQIIHGDQDPVVPYAKAVALKKRADQVNVPAELHTLKGKGHAEWALVFNSYLSQHIFPFLYEHLKLGQFSGLAVKPGYASPGKLTMQHFGVAGDQVLLAVAAGASKIPMGDLGVFLLAPSTLVVLPIAQLDATPRLPSKSVGFTVPPGLTGLGLHWQAMHIRSGAIARLLTNDVVTTL